MTSLNTWFLNLQALLVQDSEIRTKTKRLLHEIGQSSFPLLPCTTSGDCTDQCIVQSISVNTSSSHFPTKCIPPRSLLLLYSQVCVLQMSLNSHCRMWCRPSQIAFAVLSYLTKGTFYSAKTAHQPLLQQRG